MVPLILASGSETRAKILQSFRIPFVQIPVDFDEEALDHTHPKSFVYSATTGKLEAARKVLEKRQKPILCADTVVTADGAILRKAKDEADARKILEQQSGNRVKILTCSALWKPDLLLVDLSVTAYDFAPFEPADVDRYMASGHWRGKAGACMVEGFCKPYIRSVTGLESCAMGLTVEKILPFL